jgi:signal transduction histidine kinase
MTDRMTRSRLAWTAAIGATAFVVIAELVGLAVNGAGQDLWLGIIAITGSVFLALLGGLIASRTGNPVGWIFIGLVWLTGLSWVASSSLDASEKAGRAPAAWTTWLDTWPLLAGLSLFIAVFYLYPDGHLPSHRWRSIWRVYVTATVVTTIGFMLQGSGLDVHIEPGLGVALGVTGFAMLVSALASFASLIVRYRGADPDVRQQIRWLAFVGGLTLVSLFASFVFGSIHDSNPARYDGTFVGYAASVSFNFTVACLALGVPIACAIAILKYRLYDLGLVVRKTVVFGLLAVFITIVYAAVVGVVSTLANSTVGSFAAAVALAVLFAPARERARRLADRVVYGRRATPYEVLAEFSGRVGEAYAADDVLKRMAGVLAEGTGAEAATVWLKVAGEARPAATFPTGATAAIETTVAVVHQGQELGALSVTMPASDPMDPSKQKLIEDLAAQAGLVLRNVRLIEELRASRQRLVAAQDDERRKLERNLHDGAQQQLVALAVQLKLAEQMAGTNTDKERELLARLGSQANAALEDLRDLARGIYPPLLADKGLAAALETQARRAAVPTTVTVDGLGRYAQQIESAVYFCTLEALNNVAKYAEATSAVVRLSQSNGHLEFEVTDDGRGFDADAASYGTGLQGMADRLDAIGGKLRVESTRGIGSTVTGRVSVGEDR